VKCPSQLLRGAPLDQLNRELQELLFPSIVPRCSGRSLILWHKRISRRNC
jgi:hypothetical protein